MFNSVDFVILVCILPDLFWFMMFDLLVWLLIVWLLVACDCCLCGVGGLGFAFGWWVC